MRKSFYWVLFSIILFALPAIAIFFPNGEFFSLKDENIKWGESIDDLIKGTNGKYRVGEYFGNRDQIVRKNKYGVRIHGRKRVGPFPDLERVRVAAEPISYLQGMNKYTIKDYYFDDGKLVAIEYIFVNKPLSRKGMYERWEYGYYVQEQNYLYNLLGHFKYFEGYITTTYDADPVISGLKVIKGDSVFKANIMELLGNSESALEAIGELAYLYRMNGPLLMYKGSGAVAYMAWETEDSYIFLIGGYTPGILDSGDYRFSHEPEVVISMMIQDKDLYFWKWEWPPMITAKEYFEERKSPMMGFAYYWIGRGNYEFIPTDKFPHFPEDYRDF